MRPALRSLAAAGLVATGLLTLGQFTAPSRGDEPGPGRLGRLFRLGGGNADNGQAADSTSNLPRPLTTAAPALLPPPSSSPTAMAGQAGTTVESSSTRLVPQPRVSRAATEADPILTRVAIGRTDNGGRFGMFLQVFADGTILDSEGVHHVGRDALRPLVEAIQAADAFRQRGHCGGPPTDFIEQVHIVVYDRQLGRLRANAFSYSGNTQGCDHSLKHLQDAIEALQAKILSPAMAAPSPGPAPAPAAPPASTSRRSIPLTPLN